MPGFTVENVLYYFINFLLQPCAVPVSTYTLEEETGSVRVWDLFIPAQPAGGRVWT